MREWIPRFLEENKGSAKVETIWYAFKAGIKGETMRYGRAAQTKEKNYLQEQYQKLGEAETQLVQALTNNGEAEQAQAKVAIVKSSIIELSSNNVAGKHFACRSKLYECG